MANPFPVSDTSAAKNLLKVVDLGLIEYSQAYDIQRNSLDGVLRGEPMKLILCEHPVVLTMGRMAKETNILAAKETLAARGIPVHYIDRGGDITLHAPGQLVVYPILDLNHFKKDLHWYLHGLEQVVIDLLSDFDILGTRFSGRTGVWAGGRKIASLGVGVRKWITFHGLALNVNTDLNLFSLIKPCGLDVKMTSLEALRGQKVDMRLVKERMLEYFLKDFNL